jgi:hypothetical protein
MLVLKILKILLSFLQIFPVCFCGLWRLFEESEAPRWDQGPEITARGSLWRVVVRWLRCIIGYTRCALWGDRTLHKIGGLRHVVGDEWLVRFTRILLHGEVLALLHDEGDRYSTSRGTVAAISPTMPLLGAVTWPWLEIWLPLNSEGVTHLLLAHVGLSGHLLLHKDDGLGPRPPSLRYARLKKGYLGLKARAIGTLSPVGTWHPLKSISKNIFYLRFHTFLLMWL